MCKLCKPKGLKMIRDCIVYTLRSVTNLDDRLEHMYTTHNVGRGDNEQVTMGHQGGILFWGE